MLDREDMLRRFYRRIDPEKSVDPEDSELAFQLHLSRLNEPEVLEKLVKRNSGAINKWVFVQLYYQKMVDPPKEQVLKKVKEIYGYAIKHVDQFHGNESVLDWLFAITYKLSGEKKRRPWAKTYTFWRNRGKKGGYSTHTSNPGGDYILDRFSPKQWSIITLRYLFDLSVHDISMILNLQRGKVNANLRIIRKQLGMSSNTSHMEEKIEAYADGLLDDNLDELQKIKTHLAYCDECQTYATRLYELEDQLVEETSGQWSFPDLSENDLMEIIHSIKHEIKRPGPWRKIKLPIKQTAWLLGLFILFIGLAIIFIGLTPVEREFPNNSPNETTTFPPFVEFQRNPQSPEPSWRAHTILSHECLIKQQHVQWNISRPFETM